MKCEIDWNIKSVRESHFIELLIIGSLVLKILMKLLAYIIMIVLNTFRKHFSRVSSKEDLGRNNTGTFISFADLSSIHKER